MAGHTVEITTNPERFLADAGELLAAEPLLTTVVSTVTHQAAQQVAAGEPASGHPRWWAVARDPSGQVVGVAMRTAPFAPHPLYVLPMPEDSARALARALDDRGEVALAVNGFLPAAQVVADELARLTGGVSRVWERTRLHEVRRLVEPRPVPGASRLATEDDLALCRDWLAAFQQDAAEQAGRDPADAPLEPVSAADIQERITGQRVLLWEVDGEAVSLCGHFAPTLGVARVGPVYTPPEHRGRGFASAAVAQVTRQLLAEGLRVCLFTDQANPTSNRVYAALGYEPVVDAANLVIEPSGLGRLQPDSDPT